jgi:CDP-glucose 4,6-dehydratase
MTKSFYKGKKVFITGHTGFKGSWISLWLNMLGAEVTGYALEPPTNPAMFDICHVDRHIKSIIGDVRDRATLKDSIVKVKPEIVFHLAAQPIVRLSYEKPVDTYEINVMGTVNLLDAIRTCPSVKAVVVVTSDKCYENQESFWGYRETDRLGGYDPYSSSKACQELVTSAYCNSFFNTADYNKHGVAIATARAGNVIGGGDFAQDRLIPDIIRSIINNEELSIRNPDAVRPWQHVMDPLYGYLALAEKLYTDGAAYTGAWNFGPDNSNIKPVYHLVNRLYELWGKEKQYKLNKEGNPHETKCLKLDSSKANQLLNYRPKYNMEEALELIVGWNKAFMESKDMDRITIDQIFEYEKYQK